MKLQVPAPGKSDLETRPTGGKVRAAVLNMLQERLEGARVLDLFAGSGAVGLEMVSRGAGGATLVEAGRAALGCLNSNVTELCRRAAAQGLPKPAVTVISGTVESALDRLTGTAKGQFDIVWADPPYRDVPGLVVKLHAAAAVLLAPEGWLVLECSGEDRGGDDPTLKIDLDLVGPGWESRRDRIYGKTRILVREYLPQE